MRQNQQYGFPNPAVHKCFFPGMTAEMTSVTFDNTVDGYGPTGSHPYIYKFSNTAIFNLYVCYYKPVSYSKFCLSM